MENKNYNHKNHKYSKFLEEYGKGKKVIIEVRDLKKDYIMGKVVNKVLKGINLKVFKGEFLGIMGHSGSGKSTTLHQLGLLDKPTGGEIIIDGTKTSELKERQRYFFRLVKLGYLFQEYRNIPELTIIENVYLPSLMRGDKKEYYFNEAKRLLEIVGLKNYLDFYPYEVSGGEQQRVAIARALINHPDILFADEPTANLDTNSSDIILNLFKKFNHDYGQTIVMVTHEPEHIKYFDRVIYIKDGVVDEEISEKISRTKKFVLLE